MSKVVHIVRPTADIRVEYHECGDGSITLGLYVQGTNNGWAAAYARMGMGVYGAWAATIPDEARTIMAGLL